MTSQGDPNSAPTGESSSTGRETCQPQRYLNNRIFLNGSEIEDVRDYNILNDAKYEVYFYGDGNDVYLNTFRGPGRVHVNVWGTENRFSIGTGNIINSQMVIDFWGIPDKMPHKTTVEIGDSNLFNGEKLHIIGPVEPGRKLHIGNSNLFASHVLFRCRNDHAVFDLNTFERLNEDADLVLGDKNWICENVTFLPKTHIGDGCVISERALINKAFHQNNVLIAGVPGKVKRENIMWNLRTDILWFSTENPL